MKTLKFTLKTNNEEVINSESVYTNPDNKINFRIDEDLYEFNISDKTLIKKTKEGKITIDFSNSIIVITVPNIGSYDLPITVKTCSIKEKNIDLEYTTETDDILDNKIMIELQ